jgi:hypothetical protein
MDYRSIKNTEYKKVRLLLRIRAMEKQAFLFFIEYLLKSKDRLYEEMHRVIDDTRCSPRYECVLYNLIHKARVFENLSIDTDICLNLERTNVEWSYGAEVLLMDMFQIFSPYMLNKHVTSLTKSTLGMGGLTLNVESSLILFGRLHFANVVIGSLLDDPIIQGLRIWQQ